MWRNKKATALDRPKVGGKDVLRWEQLWVKNKPKCTAIWNENGGSISIAHPSHKVTLKNELAIIREKGVGMKSPFFQQTSPSISSNNAHPVEKFQSAHLSQRKLQKHFHSQKNKQQNLRAK